MMVASLTSVTEHLVQQFGYLGLLVIMAVEHTFPPIPSELVLPLAGFEVGRGNLSMPGALIASTIGSIIGASALCLIARRGGRPLVLRLRGLLRVDEPTLDRAERRFERRFERHSVWIVLLGRMVPGCEAWSRCPRAFCACRSAATSR